MINIINLTTLPYPVYPNQCYRYSLLCLARHFNFFLETITLLHALVFTLRRRQMGSPPQSIKQGRPQNSWQKLTIAAADSIASGGRLVVKRSRHDIPPAECRENQVGNIAYDFQEDATSSVR